MFKLEAFIKFISSYFSTLYLTGILLEQTIPVKLNPPPLPSLYAPLILPLDLLFLLCSEVVRNVEHLPDLLRTLAHDQVGHHLARRVHQPPYVQVVGCLHYFKEHLCLHLWESTLKGKFIFEKNYVK